MSHPLIELTEQEIFNKSVKGLASQGWQKSSKGDWGSKGCVYTLLTEEGETLHCALGWIDGNLGESLTSYSPEFWGKLGISIEDVPEGRLSYLSRLQCCHDHAINPVDMQRNLIKFAKDANLELPEVLQS